MKSVEIYEVYTFLKVLRGIMKHAKRNSDIEVIGFLVGKRYRWNGKEYVVINAYLPTVSKSTRYNVEIDEGGIEPALKIIKKKFPDSYIVGWYHSHPGFGVFMSARDIKTHRELFKEPYHVALVVDPILNEFDFYKVENDTYRKAHVRILDKRRKRCEKFEE